METTKYPTPSRIDTKETTVNYIIAKLPKNIVFQNSFWIRLLSNMELILKEHFIVILLLPAEHRMWEEPARSLNKLTRI